MKTYSAKPTDVTREWLVIDASKAPLGRVATAIIKFLTGKHKAIYTAHIDCGDNVVIINSDKLIVRANPEDKIYYRHSSYPGGLKQKTQDKVLVDDSPEIIYKAVKGMLPNNKLRADRLKRLKIYKGNEHQHTAQQPKEVKLESK